MMLKIKEHVQWVCPMNGSAAFRCKLWNSLMVLILCGRFVNTVEVPQTVWSSWYERSKSYTETIWKSYFYELNGQKKGSFARLYI